MQSWMGRCGAPHDKLLSAGCHRSSETGTLLGHAETRFWSQYQCWMCDCLEPKLWFLELSRDCGNLGGIQMGRQLEPFGINGSQKESSGKFGATHHHNYARRGCREISKWSNNLHHNGVARLLHPLKIVDIPWVQYIIHSGLGQRNCVPAKKAFKTKTQPVYWAKKVETPQGPRSLVNQHLFLKSLPPLQEPSSPWTAW